uniref:InlB B-repeat-containing protein n=1 Tax=Candidatus Electronema sp. TaxID=2698783 RepID=UPI0040575F03
MQLKLQAHWQPFAQNEVRQPRRSKPVNDRREQHWPQSVEHGNTASFEVTPSTGYVIDKVEGCDGSLNGSTYTTGPIIRNCSVTAMFKRLPKHLVIPSAGRHGSISPRRVQRVLHGETTSFTVTPRPGYVVRRVYGCGDSLSGDIYTTGAVTRSCWVRASFMKEEDAPMMSR